MGINNTNLTFFAAKNCWTHEQTNALIDEYRENYILLEKPEVNKVPIWEAIGVNVTNKFDTTFTGDNCMLKLRSLKNTYKKVEFSGRSEASKNKWLYYKVLHELFKDCVKEPEVRRFSTPTIFNDTPMLRSTTVGSDQPTIKIITEPTAVLSTINPTAAQQDLHFPVWFKQFFQVYRKNEDTKIALLTKMKNNMAVMADRQCKALEKLNEHLAKISGNSS
jgi:Myb/SANT-like DNA-binding domain